jgi:hypothetical protein
VDRFNSKPGNKPSNAPDFATELADLACRECVSALKTGLVPGGFFPIIRNIRLFWK